MYCINNITQQAWVAWIARYNIYVKFADKIIVLQNWTNWKAERSEFWGAERKREWSASAEWKCCTATAYLGGTHCELKLCLGSALLFHCSSPPVWVNSASKVKPLSRNTAILILHKSYTSREYTKNIVLIPFSSHSKQVSSWLTEVKKKWSQSVVVTFWTRNVHKSQTWISWVTDWNWRTLARCEATRLTIQVKSQDSEAVFFLLCFFSDRDPLFWIEDNISHQLSSASAVKPAHQFWIRTLNEH